MLGDIILRFKKQLIIIGVLLVASMLASLVWYIATHGIVSVENRGSETLKLIRIDNGINPEQEVKNGTAIATGMYALRNDKDGKFRTATIEVKGWLHTTKVALPNATEHKIERVAALTQGILVGNPGAYKSFDNSSDSINKIAAHAAADPFGLNITDVTLADDLQQPKLLSQSSIVGFVPSGPDAEGYDQLVKYDVTTNMTTPLSSQSFLGKRPVIIASKSLGGQALVIYEGSSKKYSYLQDGKSTDITLEKPAAFKDETPIIDINNNQMAVLTGNNYASPYTDNDEVNEVKNDSAIDLYNLTTGKKYRTITIPRSNTINSISVSANGNVAVIDADQLWVYSNTGQLLYVDPFSSLSETFWRSNTQLYSTSPDSGVVQIDIHNKVGAALFRSQNLSVNNAHLNGNMLYFGSFTTKDPTSELPDGYALNLDANDADSQKVVESLPIYHDEYRINVIGSVVTIQLMTGRGGGDPTLYNQELKYVENSARAELSKAIGDDKLSKYTIRVLREE